MNLIIFTTLKDRQLLQDMMNWTSKTKHKSQILFTGKNLKVVLSQKYDMIICTEKFIEAGLKKRGYKAILKEIW
jgi:hypothetical protein